MKRIFIVVLVAIVFNFSAVAQHTQVFLDGKESSMEEVMKIPSAKIKSMNKSVENGVAIIRITLKEDSSADTTADAAIVVNARGDILKQVYEQTTILKAGDRAADFTAKRYSGGDFRLSDYRGKVVLISFWGTWCAPCLKELAPEGLPTVLEKFKNDENFVFVPIAYKDTKEKLVAFFETPNGKTIYSYLSPITLIDSDVFSLYAKRGVPRSLVIDASGKIVFGTLGADQAELKKIETAIHEALR